MHAPITDSAKQFSVNKPTPAGLWRQLGRASLLSLALLSACGGGGGGGKDQTNNNNNDGLGASGMTYSGDFPIGVALASPVALTNSSALIPGAMGIVEPPLNTTKTLQQGVWNRQADAVATGRLDIATSGLLSVSALFDTSSRTNASCYGPAVAYANHDDSSSSGVLPIGSVAMWSDDDAASSPAVACGAAQIDALAGHQTAQIQQAMLLTAAMHQLIGSDPSHQTPSTASALNMTSRVSTLLSSLLSGVTVNSATVSLSTDPASGASQYTYRLVLTRGSGSSAQSIEINLIHVNDYTDVVYLGTLQITMGYLTSDASLGCIDQMNGGLYKVARLTSLAYNRQYNTLSLRAKSGQYCGNPTIGGSSHMTELATLNLTNELDPSIYLASNARGSTLGWRKNFSAWVQDVDLSESTNDFMFMWQDQPDGSTNGHARIFGGSNTLDLNTQTRSLTLYHGLAADISMETYALQGFTCNINGPGSNHTMQPMFQYQAMSFGNSDSNWNRSASNIAYAPTNNCNATSSMRYDVDGDGSITGSEGAGTQNSLYGLTTGNINLEAQLNSMGFTYPQLTH
ncbi:MAG: hypothetical protein QM749_10555 [Aquabacterium sp.]